MSAPEPEQPTLLAEDDWAWAFFKSYTETHLGNITQAHRAAKVSYDVYYVRRQKDLTFRALCDEAERAILDAVLQVTLEEAINGVERPIFQRGEIVGHARETDNRLRQWLLERLDPARFHLPSVVELSSGGTDGTVISFQLGEAPLEIEAAPEGEDE
jgi:hypothetical protein